MPFHCGDLFAKAESTRQPYNPARSKLEIKPYTQLDFTLRQCRSERQRSARRNCTSVREQPPRSDPVHVERCETAAAHIRRQPEEGAHFVVHTCEVGAVGNIESFRCEPNGCPLADAVRPAQTHIKINVVGAQTGVAWRADRAFIRRVVVSVHFRSREQIERMSAVVVEDRRKLESSKNRILPWAVKHPGDDNLVPLVEFRERPIKTEIRWILRTVIGVVVGGCIESLTESVVAEQCEVIAEPFFHFHNQPLIER